MTRYFRILEEQSFDGRPADYLFMLLFGMSLMLVLHAISMSISNPSQVIGAVLHIPFLSASLTFMVIYVWARRNPLVMMNFLGFLNFHAPYMPFVLLSFSFLVSGTVPKSDAIGIGVGHLYWYLVDVYPRENDGQRPLKTPRFLYD